MISIETDSISINEIFDNIQSGQHECISGMKDNIIITSAISDIVQLDADGFFYDFTYKLNQISDDMLNEFLQNNDKAKFIFKNYEFLEVHVSRTIQKIEGPIFSADKTQYIISELLNFFIFENRLEHNWSQPHTFHLPKLVFQNHKDIENYFDALYFLHAGMPSRYIDIYTALAERFPCLIDP